MYLAVLIMQKQPWLAFSLSVNFGQNLLSHSCKKFCHETKEVVICICCSISQKADSLETRAVLIEIFILRWNLLSGQKHRGWLQTKTVLSPKGINSFSGDFVLIWMKQRLIWFNLQRDGTRNGLSNIKETFAESLQLQMSVLHQRVIYEVLSSLSSSYDGWAKCKEKVPDMSDPNQNVEATCNSKLKFT